MWMVVAFLCAGYVFVGIGMIGVATTTGNWVLVGLSLLVYMLNGILLNYAKRKSW